MNKCIQKFLIQQYLVQQYLITVPGRFPYDSTTNSTYNNR